MIFIKIKEDYYRDSVFLMQLAQKILKKEGIKDSAVMMATESNKAILKKNGMLTSEAETAKPNDLIIAVDADNEQDAEAAFDSVFSMLENAGDSSASNGDSGEEKSRYITIQEAKQLNPASNFSIISVPGIYAAAEARHAINNGLNVLLFSDNVTLQQEIELKKEAIKLGKLLMGPDCGTAIIDGVPLGFANSVRRGEVGIVGASGTGIQEVITLLDKAGYGISQAIGTGGRDLSKDVGGLMMIRGIEILENDPQTRVIVVISKPPAHEVAEKVINRLKACSKPVVLNFLGYTPEKCPTGIRNAVLLEDVISEVAKSLDEKFNQEIPDFWIEKNNLERIFTEQIKKLSPERKYIRGLYSGGTLCDEAQLVLEPIIGKIKSNIPVEMDADNRAEDDLYKINGIESHILLDLGDDEFTKGRPHPMIDMSLRKKMILEVARDPQTAVILIDVVLGYGSYDDPAAELSEAVREALVISDGSLTVIASICGVDADSQSYTASVKKMTDAGAIVMPTNAQAARLSGLLVSDNKLSSSIKSNYVQFNIEKQDFGAVSKIIENEMEVINVGLKGFYHDLLSAGVKAHHVDWKPVSGGNPSIADKLSKIM